MAFPVSRCAWWDGGRSHYRRADFWNPYGCKLCRESELHQCKQRVEKRLGYCGARHLWRRAIRGCYRDSSRRNSGSYLADKPLQIGLHFLRRTNLKLSLCVTSLRLLPRSHIEHLPEDRVRAVFTGCLRRFKPPNGRATKTEACYLITNGTAIDMSPVKTTARINRLYLTL